MRGTAAIVLIASIGTLFMYRHTLEYGFDYDDYHFIRPYPAAELRAAFHGPWDPFGIEVPFYRPVTILFYAARFELFGLNSRAHHATSLGLFALAAALAGVFVWALSRRSAVAALATTVFVLHPAMPYSLVAWVTNQMHLIEIIVVLVALGWWAFVRSRGVVWWTPLLLLAAIAFLIKEDGIMLLPTIVALHWLRRRLVERSLQPVPWTFAAAAVVLIAGLLFLRADALGGLGGYGRPTVARAWTNYSRGINGVFRLVPPDRPWQPAASWFATLLPLVALALWRRSPAEVRFVMPTGILLALSFNLPFVFVTKAEQMHLVGFGAATLLAGSAATVIGALRQWTSRAVAATVIAAGLASMGAVTRDISSDFTPFGSIVLSHDDWVKDWAAVPHEVREYLKRKLQTLDTRQISTNPVDELTIVGFGLHPFETSPDGVRYRWMSQPHAQIFVAAGVRHVVVPVRHEAGAFGEPAIVTVSVDGHQAEQLTLTDGGWRMLRYTLRPDTPRFSRMHRVTITLPRVWVPERIIPGSSDDRALGLQIGEVQVR